MVVVIEASPSSSSSSSSHSNLGKKSIRSMDQVSCMISDSVRSPCCSLGQKRIKSRDRNSSLISTVLTDDLLLEIFLRLPQAIAAIRCSAVCKTWYALTTSPEFINKFIARPLDLTHSPYLDPSFSQPYTVLVTFDRSTDGYIRPNWGGRYQYLDSAEDALYLSGGSRSLFDDPPYLPWKPSLSSVRAATGDLLLVSHEESCGKCWYEFCVCNPLTRQCLPLPGSINTGCRPGYSWPFGLARHPESNGLRAVFAQPLGYMNEDPLRIRADIFNFETGSWSPSFFAASKASFSADFHSFFDDAVASSSSGILYFLLRSDLFGALSGEVTGILAIDPFKADGTEQPHRCRLISMPAGFGRPIKHDVRLATVRGRLRMSLSVPDEQNAFRSLDVRVWELRYSHDDERNEDASAWWILVHRFSMAEEVTVVGLHPNDVDTIFVLARGNNDICRYHVEQRKYHKIGEIPDVKGSDYVDDELPLFLNVFTLLHSSPPSWPAPPLPTFTSTT